MKKGNLSIIATAFFMAGISVELSNAQTIYHVARYCESEAAAQIFNNHPDEFVMEYSIGCWNGATFDANVHEFTNKDIDVIFIGGDDTFSSSTALAIEEAVFNDGKVFMLNFWSNRKFEASMPALNAGNASYGNSLTVEDPANPVFAGLPVIFYNSGPNYNRENTIEKAGSTVLMRFDDGDPALLYWKYGNGYVIEWTLECMHLFLGEENLDLINYRLLKFLMEEMSPHSFSIESPNGGEYWQYRTEHPINWTTGDSTIEKINILLSYDSGDSYDDSLFVNITNDGEELWIIPEVQCNMARIKIEGLDAEGVLVGDDESDRDFCLYTTPPVYLDSGLVAFYPFNGNANDESENENDGEVDGALLTTDRFGEMDKAYGFNGVDDHISVNDHETLRPISFTISCFVRFEPPYNGCHIITKNVSDGDWESYTLFSWPSVSSVVSCIGDDSDHGLMLQAPFNHEDLKWHHLVMIFDDLADKEQIFIDGILLAQASETKSIAYDDKPLYISGELDFSLPNYFFNGKIDDILIYNRALNVFEIQALYHEGGWKIKPTFTTALNNQAACKNDSIVFTAITECISPITYQWQKDGINIPGATDSIFILPHVQAEDEGVYQCIGTNEYGTGSSNPARLTVEFAIPTSIMGYTNVHAYQVATYSVDPQEGHTYEFTVEGGNCIDGTENSITVHWGTAGNGSVILIETSELGCAADTNSLDIYIGNLGIEESESLSLLIYPNPASAEVVVSVVSRQSSVVSQVKLSICDLFGRELRTLEDVVNSSGEYSVRMDVSDLPAGVYLVRLQIGGQSVVRKLVVQ